MIHRARTEVRHRTERAYHRRAKKLGYEVKKIGAAVEATVWIS